MHKGGTISIDFIRALKIWEEIKTQVELTFNPRTNGAKIAGRCPDTQTIETEVDRLNASDALEGDVKENFSEDRFALELARNITETSVQNTPSNWDDALKEVILSSVDDDMDDDKVRVGRVEDTVEEEAELDEYGYAIVDDYRDGKKLALLCYGKYDSFTTWQSNMLKWEAA